MCDWGLMRHRKRIPYLGQLLLSLSLSLLVSLIEEEDKIKGTMLLCNSVSASTCDAAMCVCVLMIVIGRRIEMG